MARAVPGPSSSQICKHEIVVQPRSRFNEQTPMARLFISTLQAQGVEVGLVAKLAGHKSAMVTLSHYTHAMRGGEDAVQALDRAYGPRPDN
jgi:hypothetical protein